MNILYSLLMSGVTSSGADRFSKKVSTVFHTKKSKNILDMLLSVLHGEGKEEKASLFASVICYMVRYTDFGAEIYALDPVNTYSPVTRNTDDLGDGLCISSLTTNGDSFIDMRRYLDTDIIERLQVPDWLDYVAAGCLQMLREVSR